MWFIEVKLTFRSSGNISPSYTSRLHQLLIIPHNTMEIISVLLLRSIPTFLWISIRTVERATTVKTITLDWHFHSHICMHYWMYSFLSWNDFQQLSKVWLTETNSTGIKHYYKPITRSFIFNLWHRFIITCKTLCFY